MISSSQLSVGTTYGLYSADSVVLDRHLAVGLGFEGSNVRHSRGSGTSCPTTITCYVMSTMSRLLRETWLLLDPIQNRTGAWKRSQGLRASIETAWAFLCGPGLHCRCDGGCYPATFFTAGADADCHWDAHCRGEQSRADSNTHGTTTAQVLV